MPSSIRKSLEETGGCGTPQGRACGCRLASALRFGAARIAEKVFKFSDADETEVEIGVVSDALTRFANNTIHQNVAEEVLTVSVRTVLDGRTARATTNQTDDVFRCGALSQCQKHWRAASRRIPGLLPHAGSAEIQPRSRATLRTPRTPRRPTAPAPSPAWRQWRRKINRPPRESSQQA